MKYKNILIIKLSAIGDVIHALPVASALKKNNPDTKITWIVERPAFDLLTNNPNIDEIIFFDKKMFKFSSGLVKNTAIFSRELRSRNFDLVLDLQGLFKSAAISYLSGAKERLVYCNARELSDLVSQKVCGKYQEGHVVDRYLDVVRHLGISIQEPHFKMVITDDEMNSAQDIAVQVGLDITQPYVVLAPGTNWPNKCWPTQHYAELANKLASHGIVPVITGGPKDYKLYQEISDKASVPLVDLVGKTSLKELAFILKKAIAFVGGDTGPMHLAAALQVPVVAMFGPTNPERNGPYGSRNVVLSIPDDCRGCWKRRCPLKKECMENITSEQVFNALQMLVNKNLLIHKTSHKLR